jgi:hypothetical protein
VRAAVPSTDEAFRWRAVGRWAAKQPWLQKMSFIFPELHAVTEQRKKVPPKRTFFRHMQQTAKTSSGISPLQIINKNAVRQPATGNLDRPFGRDNLYQCGSLGTSS